VDKPTIARGDDTSHILELVISEEIFLQNLSYESLLGNSDHCVLMFDSKVHTSKQNYYTVKRALSKGDYDGLRASLNNDWTGMLQQHDGNVEAMWQLFKGELEAKIDQYVPIANNFNLRKESWTRPLDIKVRHKISGKHRLWKICMRSRDPTVFKQYKSARNVVRKDIKKN